MHSIRATLEGSGSLAHKELAFHCGHYMERQGNARRNIPKDWQHLFGKPVGKKAAQIDEPRYKNGRLAPAQASPLWRTLHRNEKGWRTSEAP